MLVLHAAYVKHGLWVWGERSCGTAPSGTRKTHARANGPSGGRRPRKLPFDAGAEAVHSAIAEWIDLPRSGARVSGGKLVAWLPTAGARPIASSPMIEPPPNGRAKRVLAPWKVDAVALEPVRCLDLLSACRDRHTLAPGVVVGEDLKYWARALRWAGSLVARQQFLPGLEEKESHYRARWQPVICGSDAQVLSKLAASMPGAARAISAGNNGPPQSSPATVLGEFVNEMADVLVREGTGPLDGAPVPGPRRPSRRARASAATFESAHDLWVHALGSDNPALPAETKDAGGLAAQILEWKRPVTTLAESPFRLCFRLEEPSAEELPASGRRRRSAAGAQRWYVRYLLHANDDPSLLIPVQQAWRPRGARASALRRRGFIATEYLLLALGQAANVCPRIEESLNRRDPGGLELDAAGANEFLTRTAPTLEQAGFGVMLPAWWTGSGTKVRLSVRARAGGSRQSGLQARSGLSLSDLVDVKWEVALGGTKLSRKEIEALAALKAPLVKLRGRWVHVSGEEIRSALELFKRRRAERMTAGELVHMAIGAAPSPGGLAFEGVSARGWMGGLLGRLEGRVELKPLPAPKGFTGTLRPYQERGYAWLEFLRRWGLGACLADDMGLGKTIQTLALIQRDWRDAAGNGSPRRCPVLLVCPMSVVGNWYKEAQRFTPELPVLVHHGADRRKNASFRRQAARHAMVICSYALLHRDLSMLKPVKWAGVVLDEAQNIKNPATKQAEAARALRAEYRIALTGTPVENHVGDLWSIMEFLNPGLLGSQAQFKREFFSAIQGDRDPSAAERLKRITGPFVLRRLKTDRAIIADLPRKLEMKVYCTLTREQASLYAAVVREGERSLDGTGGIERKGLILAMLSKLKQVCNHPRQFLGDGSSIPARSGKLARLTEMLEEILETRERALVFTQFSEMGGILKEHLQEVFGREVLFLHGGVTKRNRDRMVERFQAKGEGPPIFVLSLKAGGTGLNLTRANHVFHFDRWWNPAVESQATDRAFRIGQKRNVQVHKFVCAGTLEERIDQMIEDKRGVAERVVGSGEGWLTRLSTGELKEILKLRRDVAVAE